MRKKSHISLAKYIVNNVEVKELNHHKKAFYLGNILPDCKPSFITTRHEFSGTFEKVEKEIIRLVEGNDKREKNMRAYCRDLGQVVHYLADYFTFPHNSVYKGSIKDHCVYEENLKIGLREYIKTQDAQRRIKTPKNLNSAQSICDFIRRAHGVYLRIDQTVEDDCKYIVWLCHQVVVSILQLVGLYRTDFIKNREAAVVL